MLDTFFRRVGQSLRRRARQSVDAGDQARDGRRWADAGGHYRKALDLDPSLFPIWIQYGHALKEGGRVEEACGAYRRALALMPHDPEANLQLGYALEMLGRLDDAAIALRHTADQQEVIDRAKRRLRDFDPPPPGEPQPEVAAPPAMPAEFELFFSGKPALTQPMLRFVSGRDLAAVSPGATLLDAAKRYRQLRS